ncbi:MAG: hypothetical protein ABFC34_16455 [Methanobacterium sp.]
MDKDIDNSKIGSVQINETPSENHDQKTNKSSNKFLLVIICILLSVLVLINSYQVFATRIQEDSYEKQVKEAQQLVESQNLLLGSMISDYDENVYDNQSVDNIYKQQFVASEYIFLTLQMIAKQNIQIINLLISLP